MNDKVNGLVLRQIDYRDYDVILLVLTKEYGKISFCARGAKKLTSKNSRHLLPYTLSEIMFDYVDGKTMFTLKSANTINLYKNIQLDLNLSSCASVIGEVADKFSMNGDANEMFDLVKRSYELLNSGYDCLMVLGLFLSDVMKLFGISPSVDSCVYCSNQHINSFSSKEGGFLCNKHAHEYQTPILGVNDLRKIRLMIKGGLNHIDVIRDACEFEISDVDLLVDIINRHSGFEINSYNLFKKFLVIE